ncbi:hypothetical protein [Phycicoccus avicenniae]|uniref:hypothetical protein n=1 Tax=Phycicoccus avicenniae TaxID=2828860 RepID=UPI003D2716EF
MFRKVNEFRRYMKNRDAMAAALVPDEAVVADAPMPGLAPAMEAAVAGDHAPAADLLASTHRRRAWDDRSHAVDLLARMSLRTPQWLDAWETEAGPDDPAPLVVRSALGLNSAWEHRTRERAENVSQEQFKAFHATLGDTTDTLQRAVDRTDDDPEPWRLGLIHARGLEAPPEVWQGYVSALREIDPWHHGGLRAALELQTAKWFGSHEQAYDVAFGLAAEAPADSRVRTLPLDAVFEHAVADGAEDVARAGRAEEAIALTTGWLAQADPERYHVVAVHRGVLAATLMLLGRFDESFDEFVALGPHATRYPWGYWADDPREGFLRFRSAVSVKAAGRK